MDVGEDVAVAGRHDELDGDVDREGSPEEPAHVGPVEVDAVRGVACEALAPDGAGVAGVHALGVGEAVRDERAPPPQHQLGEERQLEGHGVPGARELASHAQQSAAAQTGVDEVTVGLQARPADRGERRDAAGQRRLRSRRALDDAPPLDGAPVVPDEVDGAAARQCVRHDGRDVVDEPVDRVAGATPGGLRVTGPADVERHHVVVGREPLRDRVPHAAVVGEPVQQQHGRGVGGTPVLHPEADVVGLDPAGAHGHDCRRGAAKMLAHRRPRASRRHTGD